MPSNCGLVRVLDGIPRRSRGLARFMDTELLSVEHFGQSGSIPDLYRHDGIDANAIVMAAETLVPGRPIRHLRAL